MTEGRPHKLSQAKILIVDDHPIVREGLRARISQEPNLEVCGEAEDVAEGLKLSQVLHPDLILVDISLRSGNGIDLIKRIQSHDPSIKILVHSMYDDSTYAERSLRAGASGYLNKQAASQEIIVAIRQVLEGKVYLSSEAKDRLVKRSIGRSGDPGESSVDRLSDREMEVFALIGRGLTTRAIAGQLHLSPHTIDTYREKLKTKLNVSDGAELNRYAFQWVLENG